MLYLAVGILGVYHLSPSMVEATIILELKNKLFLPKLIMTTLILLEVNVTLSTSATTDDEAYWLLKEFGFPLIEV